MSEQERRLAKSQLSPGGSRARRTGAASRARTHGRRRLARLVAVVSALCLLLVVAGCGDDDSGDSDAGAAKTSKDGGATTLRVTSLPILDAAPYFWALDTGMFEENGLKVEDRISAGGAADLPALVSGDLDLAFSNTVSAILAQEQGLPIKIVVATNENHPEGGEQKDDYVAIVTGPKSDITSPAQLEGKKMAVNTLNNINHLFSRAWLESEGVDPDSVEFLEVPFPDQPVALERGRVDATMIGAPFLQALQGQGAKVLGYPYRVLPKVTVATFIGTDEFVEANPEAMDRFRETLGEANAAVDDPANRERLLDILEKRTKIDRPTLEKAVLPVFTTNVDMESLSDIAGLMRDDALIDTEPNLDELVAK